MPQKVLSVKNQMKTLMSRWSLRLHNTGYGRVWIQGLVLSYYSLSQKTILHKGDYLGYFG